MVGVASLGLPATSPPHLCSCPFSLRPCPLPFQLANRLPSTRSLLTGSFGIAELFLQVFVYCSLQLALQLTIAVCAVTFGT